MSQLTKSQYNTKYNSSGTGSFLDNTTQLITASIMRVFALDNKDSIFFLSDNAYNGALGLSSSITSTTDLKTVVTTSLSNVIVVYRDSTGVLNSYKLVSGTDAESLPNVVRPTDYATTTNEKVWKKNFLSGSNTRTSVSTSGGTITLDMVSQPEMTFIGSASFSGAKTWAISNDSAGIKFKCIFTIITSVGAQTLPSNFKMESFNGGYDSGSHTWTPVSTGTYVMEGISDGTNWYIKINGDFV